MELLILHLSDIHLKKQENPVMERVADLQRLIRSMLKEYDACFVVISGDLAFSGKKEEYEVGFEFVAAIDEVLRSSPTIGIHEFILVPGNHDCDLSESDQKKTRETLAKSLLSNPANFDEEMLRQCLKVQDQYENFLRLVFDLDTTELANRFLSSKIYNVGGEQVIFDLYNTAWLSMNPEEIGRLLGPPDCFLKDRERGNECSVRLAVLHHPLHWIKPEAARTLRAELESEADLILTGHEHVQSQYTRAAHGKIGADYIEGGVMQESKDPTQSSLNLVEISITQREYKVTEFTWDGKQYSESNAGQVQAFKRARKDSRRRFVLTDYFYGNYLKNAGAQFTHGGFFLLTNN